MTPNGLTVPSCAQSLLPSLGVKIEASVNPALVPSFTESSPRASPDSAVPGKEASFSR